MISNNNSQTNELVTVTGASGFIAMHCILKLLGQGYRVRGTLRTPSRGDGIRKALGRHVDIGDRLEFVKADRPFGDVVGVVQLFCDQDVDPRQEQRRVGSRLDREPVVGLRCHGRDGLCLPRRQQ